MTKFVLQTFHFFSHQNRLVQWSADCLNGDACMDAVALIFLALLFTPFLGRHPLGVAVLALFLAPGLYALWTGAPFIPSAKRSVDAMLKLAYIKPGDKVFDLGCGDGRLLLEAAKLDATATGYELSPFVFLFAKFRTLRNKSIRVHFRDFWGQDYRTADVLFCYLLPESMQTFQQRIWPALKPGCRVVSHAFVMDGVAVTEQLNDIRLYIK